MATPLSPARELVRRLAARAIVLPLLLTGLLAAVLLGELAYLVNTARWVTHTDAVIAQAEEVEARVVDLQTGLRGYLLTGEERFLAPYHRSAPLLEPDLVRLVALVSDNPVQEEHALRLQQQGREWLRIAGETLARGGRPPEDGLRERLRRNEARMERLRGEIGTFIEAERALRDTRTVRARTAIALMEGSALGLTLLLGAVLALFSRRQLTQLASGYEEALDRNAHQARALREGEERLRLLVERVEQYAITFLSPEGRVQTWNPAAERIQGFRAEEIIGQHVEVLFTEEDRRVGLPARALAQAEAQGSCHGEGWRVRRDGSRFWADVSLTALRVEDGTLQGFASLTRDLTERREAEEAIRRLTAGLEQRVAERTEALQRANEELEGFSYSVSHDLRTPLRPLDGFSKVLLERYGHLLDAQGRHYLERIRAGSQRMAQLIDDLLRLSRIAREEFRPGPVDLADLAREVIQELRARAPDRRVEVSLPPRLPAVGDARLLRIALENLLGNAWKFTGEQAEPRIELGGREEGGHTVYFVRDNGAGFDMAHADKLFSPFQRLHDGSEFEGAGIGLATVHRIVRRHGGRIWAESAVGQGATILFTLGGRQT